MFGQRGNNHNYQGGRGGRHQGYNKYNNQNGGRFPKREHQVPIRELPVERFYQTSMLDNPWREVEAAFGLPALFPGVPIVARPVSVAPRPSSDVFEFKSHAPSKDSAAAEVSSSLKRPKFDEEDLVLLAIERLSKEFSLGSPPVELSLTPGQQLIWTVDTLLRQRKE